MRPGDLVTVALPGDFGKPRPGLVIQSDLFNDTHSKVALITDGRFSGGSRGLLHRPRRPRGGGRRPIGLLRDGDMIAIDAEKGTIDAELSEAELAERRTAFQPRPTMYASGTLWKCAQTVGPAEKGAVTHLGAQAEVKAYADI